MARKEKKYHFIYKTTNVLNGKYYIGLHSTDNMADGYMGSGRKLKYSINKYGKENHKVEIIEYCADRKTLVMREKEIVTTEEIQKTACMNLCVGGDNNYMYGNYMSVEHKAKISLANSGAKNGMFGKKHPKSPATIEKLSKTLRNSEKLKISRQSEEYKKKISKHFGRPIYIVDKEFNIVNEFNSMTIASLFFECTEANIFNARRDGRMIKRKYWIVYKDDFEQFKIDYVNKS